MSTYRKSYACSPPLGKESTNWLDKFCVRSTVDCRVDELPSARRLSGDAFLLDETELHIVRVASDR